jgi:hypothetical protein
MSPLICRRRVERRACSPRGDTAVHHVHMGLWARDLHGCLWHASSVADWKPACFYLHYIHTRKILVKYDPLFGIATHLPRRRTVTWVHCNVPVTLPPQSGISQRLGQHDLSERLVTVCNQIDVRDPSDCSARSGSNSFGTPLGPVSPTNSA